MIPETVEHARDIVRYGAYADHVEITESRIGARTKVSVRDLSIQYGEKVALDRASFEIYEHEIFVIIGPANSGKTSFLHG